MDGPFEVFLDTPYIWEVFFIDSPVNTSFKIDFT